MTKVIVGAANSRDGYLNHPSGSVEALYPVFAAMLDYGPMRDSIQNTGAVVMGRNTR